MKRKLPRLGILLLIIFIASLSASAASGVYLTYDDFKKGNLIKADEGTFDYKDFARNVIMKVGGVKKTYANKNIWAFLYNDNLYRTMYDPQLPPTSCKLLVAGKYCYWQFGGNSAVTVTTENMTREFISYGVGGEGFLVWSAARMSKDLKKQPELKPVLDCSSAAKKSDPKSNFSDAVSDCIKSLPGYIADVKSVVPPIKN
jgi:hypothetical protein